MLISATELRGRFAAEDCIGRALRYHYTCCLNDTAKPSSPDEPYGTKSITLRFFDEHGDFAFLVHCYWRPDNTLGATRQLDPKRMVGQNGIDYYTP
jgi:hypothetical protein